MFIFLLFLNELVPSMFFLFHSYFIWFYFQNAASYQNPQGVAQNENDPNNTTVRTSLLHRNCSPLNLFVTGFLFIADFCWQFGS